MSSNKRRSGRIDMDSGDLLLIALVVCGCLVACCGMLCDAIKGDKKEAQKHQPEAAR